MKDSSYSPHFQHGTHFIIQPSSHHTSQYTTNSTQTSAQMPIFYLSRQLHSRQHPILLRQLRWWRRRFPYDTLGWWTLDFWRNTWERTLCIHEHGLPHGLCQYPCPYANYDTIFYMDSLDLSDISDYEDYMVTSSDEEIPGLEEVPYWYRTLVFAWTLYIYIKIYIYIYIYIYNIYIYI